MHAKTGMDGARSTGSAAGDSRATSLRAHRRRSTGSAAGDSRATSLRAHRRRSTGSAAGDSRRRLGLQSALVVLAVFVVVVAALIVAPHLLRLLEDVLEMRLDQRGEICFEEW